MSEFLIVLIACVTIYSCVEEYCRHQERMEALKIERAKLEWGILNKDREEKA